SRMLGRAPTKQPTRPKQNPNRNSIKEDRSWATKRWFITKLKQLLSNENVAGHSFRAGETTELVTHDTSAATLQRSQQFSPKYTPTDPGHNLGTTWA
ncbi:6427_t:CDS:2, partial [Racocetra persica]